ncbi:MAG: zinc ribbon domain-containing protein [Chloroflexi bacterium]|nr:zinc ribbon domain-containing protein [Chloroflexota bacterium]
MPVYVYQCTNCGVQFDKLQSFTDHPLVRCPECGKHKLKKVYQPVGIVFKGSGFYATDHHSPSGQSPIKSDKTEGSQEAGATPPSPSGQGPIKNGKKDSSQVAETTPKD